ncbi:MAG: rhamnogalacturonan acetylesterase [Planctomycetales bacterium]|nr:rhamnogalacturonan acetylesterase [Planctomycetales bacterium]
MMRIDNAHRVSWFSLLLIASLASAAGAANESLQPKRPATLFLIGDSTVKNGSGQGDRGQWGWGQVLQQLFDHDRLRVENRALGGRSSRTYLTEGLWQKTLERIQPGDFVLMQFGHNDGGQMFESDRPRASLKGNGDETREGVVAATGKHEVVYSYGWYLRRYVAESKAKGATPIVLSLVPRDIWKDGRIVRAEEDYGNWAREAAQQAGAAFVDLNQIVADRYERDGQPKVHEEYFTPADHTHTSRIGAEVNANCVAQGMRSLDNCDLAQFLLPPRDTAVRIDFGPAPAEEGFTAVANGAEYSAGKGYGFEASGELYFASCEDFDCVASANPYSFSILTPEGNHRVRITLGNAAIESRTEIEGELRRRLADGVLVAAGQTKTIELLVNTRTPVLLNDRMVRLKERELTSEANAWDSRLTLRFAGENPSVAKLEVLPAPEAPTLFLLGDSTVADQPSAPWASWGQKLPRYFDSEVAVANHAESGETIAAAWSRGRCDKVLECLRPGDWLMVQFGHNDMKSKAADALERYRIDLRRLILETKERGATPVLVTSMERKSGVEQDTLGEYPQTMRDLAVQEDVVLIDLHARSRQLYRRLGGRLGSLFQDGTHHNDAGADMLAACVVDGIREKLPDLAAHLTPAEPVAP